MSKTIEFDEFNYGRFATIIDIVVEFDHFVDVNKTILMPKDAEKEICEMDFLLYAKCIMTHVIKLFKNAHLRTVPQKWRVNI